MWRTSSTTCTQTKRGGSIPSRWRLRSKALFRISHASTGPHVKISKEFPSNLSTSDTSHAHTITRGTNDAGIEKTLARWEVF